MTAKGEGEQGVKGFSTKDKGLMDVDNRVVIVGGWLYGD